MVVGSMNLRVYFVFVYSSCLVRIYVYFLFLNCLILYIILNTICTISQIFLLNNPVTQSCYLYALLNLCQSVTSVKNLRIPRRMMCHRVKRRTFVEKGEKFLLHVQIVHTQYGLYKTSVGTNV